MPEYLDACGVSEVANNRSVARKIGGKRLLICNSDGRIFAIHNRCSHAGMTLDGGRISNGVIFCPVHGEHFDLESGCPSGALTKEPTPVYETRIVGGRIEVLV